MHKMRLSQKAVESLKARPQMSNADMAVSQYGRGVITADECAIRLGANIGSKWLFASVVWTLSEVDTTGVTLTHTLSAPFHMGYSMFFEAIRNTLLEPVHGF